MKLFTVKETAAQIGISPALVYALIARRKIRHERHGLGRGTIKIPEDAIEEYRRAVTVASEVVPVVPVPAGGRRYKHLV